MPKGSTLTIDPWHFFSEKTLKGSFLGSANIATDVPRLVDLYADGELEVRAGPTDGQAIGEILLLESAGVPNVEQILSVAGRGEIKP